MARKTRIAAAIERAQKSLTSQVLAAAMAEVPGSTPVSEVISALKKEGFASHLETMTLADFVAAAGGSVATRRPGRPARSAAAAGGARKKSFNTRTDGGREALDAAIAEFLKAAGSARSEAIRGSVGATSAQIRQSMARLMGGGKVVRKGQKRGTEYHWKSGGTAAAGSAGSKRSKAGKVRRPRRSGKRGSRGAGTAKAKAKAKAKARAAKG